LILQTFLKKLLKKILHEDLQRVKLINALNLNKSIWIYLIVFNLAFIIIDD